MKKDKRTIYFRKQRAIGVCIVLLAVLSIILFEGDATAAVLIAPIGLYMIFTKKMVWTDDYFYEVQEEESQK